LPAPASEERDAVVPNHTLVPGARIYPSHTGSPIDMPSKTLKAGAHGVPGGENSVVQPDGQFRYFTIRECARLQAFPDQYVFVGTWKSLVSQVGNAVPVTVVKCLGQSIHRHLVSKDAHKQLRRPPLGELTRNAENTYSDGDIVN